MTSNKGPNTHRATGKHDNGWAAPQRSCGRKGSGRGKSFSLFIHLHAAKMVGGTVRYHQCREQFILLLKAF